MDVYLLALLSMSVAAVIGWLTRLRLLAVLGPVAWMIYFALRERGDHWLSVYVFLAMTTGGGVLLGVYFRGLWDSRPWEQPARRPR